MRELASNIFTMTPEGKLDLGSTSLGGTSPVSANPYPAGVLPSALADVPGITAAGAGGAGRPGGAGGFGAGLQRPTHGPGNVASYGYGQQIVINSKFSQVPEDPFVWLRHVGTAARFAMT